MSDETKIISLEGLAAFKNNMDTSVDGKIAEADISGKLEAGKNVDISTDEETGKIVISAAVAKTVAYLQSTVPESKSVGLVWIDENLPTVVETKDIEYVDTTPIAPNNGDGWIGD